MELATTQNTPESLLKQYLAILDESTEYPLSPSYGEQPYGDPPAPVTEQAKEVVRCAVRQFPAHPTTDLMVRHVRLLSDRARQVPPQENNDKIEAGSSKLVEKTYDVTDLVTVRPKKIIGKIAPPQSLKPEEPDGDVVSLIELIVTTVQPSSWNEVGGPGAISPNETGRTLAIRQTEVIHRETANLLEKLHRTAATQLAVEVQLLTGPADIIAPLLQSRSSSIKPQGPAAPAGWPDNRLIWPPHRKELIATAQRDPRLRVTDLARATVFNGQTAMVYVPDNDMGTTSTPVTILLVASRNRRTIRAAVGLPHWVASYVVPEQPLECIGMVGGSALAIDLNAMASIPASGQSHRDSETAGVRTTTGPVSTPTLQRVLLVTPSIVAARQTRQNS